MDYAKRCRMIRAMETIARAMNDEDVFEIWLTDGVADGDIDGKTVDEDLKYYAEDAAFADLMDTFLYMMHCAYKSGGLYEDGVISKPDHE